MSLVQSFNGLLNQLLQGRFEPESIISCLDLTLLDEKATANDIQNLEAKAIAHKVAAICIYVQDYQWLMAEEHAVHRATVVNFPLGNESIENCFQTIEQALLLKITEIDYVFPYSAYISGDRDLAMHHASKIADFCQQHGLTLKIILETGAFSDQQMIYELAREVLALNCQFLKTSTGKIAQGASLSAVFALLSAIQDSGSTCGVKVSGGVKTAEQAFAYAQMAELVLGKSVDPSWFRIGASSLLDALSGLRG